MRFNPDKCPECGEPPQGTNEELPGCAEFEVQANGSYEHSGNTEVFWDGAHTVQDDRGRTSLLCANGHDWFAEEID